MKHLLIAMAIIFALAGLIPPEWTRILCLGWIGLFMIWGMIRVGMAKEPETPYPLIQGYVIKNRKTDYESVVPEDVARRAKNTGDYDVRLASHQDAGNNYQNDGLGTPGGMWVPRGMLVDDGTIHKYKDERLN